MVFSPFLEHKVTYQFLYSTALCERFNFYCFCSSFLIFEFQKYFICEESIDSKSYASTSNDRIRNGAFLSGR